MKRRVLKILYAKDLRNKIGLVVGTRPGVIMFSPIIRKLARRKADFFVIHAGQHYSYNMDKKFFEDLRLPQPRYRLNNMRRYKLHGEQTARMLEGIEKVLVKEKPKIFLVGGDANCNLSGAIAARKLHICVGHIEAGERSFDWRMPEEHNRVLIDHVSDYLFVTNAKSKKNLIKEAVKGRVYITGNPIVDAARENRELALKTSRILSRLRLEEKDYFLLTTHREENVDNEINLANIFNGIERVCRRFKKEVIFCAHPRTLNRIRTFRLQERVKSIRNLRTIEAIGYLDFIRLLASASLVFTDSGGVQQEGYIFRVPCVTLRENTEWTETVKRGANFLAGTNPSRIVRGAGIMLKRKISWRDDFGDGRCSSRIHTILTKELSRKR